MGTSTPNLSTLESGKRQITEKHLRTYAEAIGVPFRRVWSAYWLAVELEARRRLRLARSEKSRAVRAR